MQLCNGVLNNLLMEEICDDTGLTVKTNERKKRGGKMTQNEAKTRRVLQTDDEEYEEEEELTASRCKLLHILQNSFNSFLAQTKGRGFVQLQHFPHLTGSIISVAQFRRQDTFDKLDVYRLKKTGDQSQSYL